MEVKKDFKNDLMQRREIQLIVDAEKTPSYAEANKLISEHFKVAEENILVEKVKGKFGRKTFLVEASIYSTKELMEEAKKRKTKVKKKAAAEGEQDATASPAEAKK